MKKNIASIWIAMKELMFFSYLSLLVNIPYAAAQWVQTKGPSGGNVTALAQQGNYLFAGTTAGIYRSEDAGITWSRLNDAPINNINAITPGGSFLFAGTTAGAFISSDNGNNWGPVLNGLAPDLSINTFTLSGGNVLAGTDSGMFYSIDNGISWQPSFYGLSSLGEVSAVVVSGANTYASSQNAIYKSTDQGLHWSYMGSSNTLCCGKLLFAEGNALYASYSYGGIRRSLDGGASWGDLSGSFDHVVNDLIKNGSSWIAGTTSGICISTNDFYTWSTAASTTWVNDLLISGSALIMGNNYGISISSDGGYSWNYQNTGLVASYTYGLTALGNSILCVQQNSTPGATVYKSVDGGENWVLAMNGLPLNMYYYSPTAIGNILLITLFNSGTQIYKSIDTAEQWSLISTNNPQLNDIAFEDNNAYATTWNNITYYSQIIHSSDYGATWSSPLVDTPYNFYRIEVRGSDVFATSNGYLFRSFDSGTTFEIIPAPISSEFFFGINDSDLYIQASSGSGGIYTGMTRSDNNGDSWVSIGNGFPDTHCQTMVFNGISIYAATDSGVFYSSDRGATWTAINEGLAPVPVTSLVIAGSEMYAATLGAGVWKRSLTEISGVSHEMNPDLHLSIYPNPFQESTTISSSLLKQSNVSLEIFSLTGQKVKTILMNQNQAAGQHHYNFHGTGNGVYFVKLTVDGTVLTEKIIQADQYIK